MSMRALPNVSLVGEPTAGAFSTILEKPVTSDIAYGFSNEFYLSTEGDWFEHTGTPVDHIVALPSRTEREKPRDAAIDAACIALGL